MLTAAELAGGDEILHLRHHHWDHRPWVRDTGDLGYHADLHHLCLDLPEARLDGSAPGALRDQDSGRAQERIDDVADPQRELLHPPIDAGPDDGLSKFHLGLGQCGRDTLLTRLLRGALSSIVILLVADLIWQVVKSLIDRQLSQVEALSPPGTEAAVRQARLRTLLPIFRNVIFVVLAVVAVMMALSALGVEIGPLIAGAGIVGVAVGFGSQTLVKDVISDVFYLLDDAFRVGEYITSGSYKGTVESFGFRSVKLRHHRGPLFTVPFGVLGAVQNMSRDWVIDKLTIGVSYDSDFDKAKKLIKQIGRDLAEDPEFAPHIIEPLKMQGVEQFGDYGIQIRLKMMTKPGEQFVIRRRALALIKQAFDENGIRFAVPTVQVAGHEEAGPVAAHQALELVKPPPPE